jgi:hypothetical protein
LDAPLIVIKHCFNIVVLRWCLLLLACYAPTHAWAQLSNERVKVLASADTLVLDSLSLIPQSVQISTLDGAPCKAFMVLNVKSQLIRIDPTFTDSIRVSYRVFPTAFPSRIFNKDTTLITAAGSGMIQAYVPQPFTAENLLDDSGIRKSGSISRGVSFGNAQNLTVNSNLNLQMNGRLSDRFQLLASNPTEVPNNCKILIRSLFKYLMIKPKLLQAIFYLKNRKDISPIISNDHKVLTFLLMKK